MYKCSDLKKIISKNNLLTLWLILITSAINNLYYNIKVETTNLIIMGYSAWTAQNRISGPKLQHNPASPQAGCVTSRVLGPQGHTSNLHSWNLRFPSRPLHLYPSVWVALWPPVHLLSTSIPLVALSPSSATDTTRVPFLDTGYIGVNVQVLGNT